MKYWISVHYRNGSYELVGTHQGMYDLPEILCRDSSALDDPSNNATMAKLYRQIMKHRDDIGKPNEGIYAHIISISPLPEARDMPTPIQHD